MVPDQYVNEMLVEEFLMLPFLLFMSVLVDKAAKVSCPT